MATVLVPEPYRGPTRGVGEVTVAGPTVLECLRDAEGQYPGFLALVIDDSGSVHRFVKLFLNDVQLIGDAVLETSVADSDRIGVLAAIAGG